MTALAQEKCAPCESKASPMPESEIQEFMKQLPGWTLEKVEGVPRIKRSFSFSGFSGAVFFAAKLAEAADRANHHPMILIEYGKATASWWSHNIKGLHKNDFIMAAKTDKIYKSKEWVASARHEPEELKRKRLQTPSK